MGRFAVVLLVAGVLVLPGACFELEAPEASAATGSCGSKRDVTITATSSVRIFERLTQPSQKGRVFACRKPSGPPVLLGPHPQRGWMASMPGPFVIQRSWAAGVERRQLGQDSSALYSSARNAASGSVKPHCLIGGGDRPGQMPKVQRLFATPSGSVVWVADLPVDQKMQIAVCEGEGLRLIAEGDDGSIKDVSLKGYQLRWLDEEGTHSVRVG